MALRTLAAGAVALALLPAAAEAHHFKPCAPKEGPAVFTEYHLGDSFEGDSLSERVYHCARPTPPPELPTRTHVATFLYEGDDQLQVQTAPACDRWWGSYNFGSPDTPIRRPKLIEVRGVPAARIDDASLELYTGDVTVTVFANTRAKANRAAEALRQGGSEPGGDLPPPLPGALRGRMDCGFRFSKLDMREGDKLLMGVPRAAYMEVELERREDGEWAWSHQFLFRVAKGTTYRELGVRPGRYRGTVTAWDHRGRRTHVRAIRFRERAQD